MRRIIWLGLLTALVVGCGGEEAMHPGDSPRDAVEAAGRATLDAGRATGKEIESLSDAARSAEASDDSAKARQAARAEADAAQQADRAASEAERQAKAAGSDAAKALEGTEYEQFEKED